MWTCNELSELVTYSQCMPLELELKRTWVNLWQSNTNLNMWVERLNTQVLIGCMRKTGIHSRFGAREHEVRNKLHRIKLLNHSPAIVVVIGRPVHRITSIVSCSHIQGIQVCIMPETIAGLHQYTGLMVSYLLLLPCTGARPSLHGYQISSNNSNSQQ